ncbi:ATP-binding protein [Pseudomonas promysalinigenes]|uniref:ATP-binding protein n=1 Tax=Pseudomonas promysalinigenes TaxID=485898 RepID=UPI003FA04135
MPSDDPTSCTATQGARQCSDSSQATSKLLAELIDHSLANVFAFDRDFRLLAINRTAQQTFQRVRSMVPQVGDNLLQWITRHPDLAALMQPFIPRMVAGQPFTESIALGPADDLRHYQIIYNALSDPEHGMLGGSLFAYDISERVAEQARMRKIEEALYQSQKMEAVGQLTGGIAHDFNNLLGGILGALEMAEQHQDEQRYLDTTRLLGVARQNALRAASLVQRLLAFSRQQTLAPQLVNVHQLVAGMHELIASSLGTRITFIDQTQQEHWPVLIDPNQLENTLLNLCINARDAMPSGGTVLLASDNTLLDQAQAQALELPSGSYLHVSVSDSGTGMPAEVLQRAFDPFFTTKPAGQGSGLGLSIVYGFVRQSGGQVRITSNPEQGTCVHLYLPRAASQASAHTDGQPQTVMVVEGQAVQRMLICEVLEEQGHRVHSFSDGYSALQALRGGLRPDLLITDISLPGGIDGYQVAAACQKRPECVLVLFITSSASSRVNVRPDPYCDVLYKPFELAALSQHVEKLLKNRYLPR